MLWMFFVWYIIGVFSIISIGVYCDKGLLKILDIVYGIIAGIMGGVALLILFIMVTSDHGDKIIFDFKKVKYIKKLWDK